MEIFKIIAFSPPLSPSSLSFIPSVSSWCRIKSSKTGQWRFKLSKLINYSRKYGVYTRPWLPYIFVKNVLKSASRLKKYWKTRSGQSTELLRLSVQKSKLSTTNWIFVECFLKLSSSCFCRFTQNYGVLGVLDRLHGTDVMFRDSRAYDRHIMLLGFIPLKQTFPDNPKKGSPNKTK